MRSSVFVLSVVPCLRVLQLVSCTFLIADSFVGITALQKVSRGRLKIIGVQEARKIKQPTGGS